MKPTIQKEVATTHVLEHMREIYFYATKDSVTEFVSFGQITHPHTAMPAEFQDNYAPDYYWLKVDPRFNFQDVVNYIQNYG